MSHRARLFIRQPAYRYPHSSHLQPVQGSQILLLTSRSGSRVGQNTQAMVPKITDLTITVMGIQVALTGFKAFMHSHDMLYREGRS